jgi:hypothetical protein
MNEDNRKHLDLIQGVINRLAGNSFSVKTWAVGLITVLVGFSAKDANAAFAVALILPALCFWGLDAYYLRQERLYRKLFEKAVKGTVVVYTMKAADCEDEIDRRVVWAPTVASIHGPILLFVIGAIVYSFAHKR